MSGEPGATERAVDLYVNHGWTLRRIAAELHYSHVEIWRRLRAAGVTLRSRGTSDYGPAATSDERP